MISRSTLTALGAGLLLTITAFGSEHSARAQDADLAKQLSNPVASLISVPFQFNYDENIGAADAGERVTLNIQPVIPISIAPGWNMISRTIMPVLWQEDVFAPAELSEQSGVGDIVQSLFFSPELPGPSGIIWGAGPVLLLPTATNNRLGVEKWGAGPTAVVLRQQHGWTYGALANHIWSFAGDGSRADVNATFLEPFIAYTTPNAWTFTVNSESTYDWEADEWSVPVNFMVAKLTKLGSQPVQLQGGVRYWVKSSSSGPEGWGARASVTFLFPRGSN
jgi:hypothetical protein